MTDHQTIFHISAYLERNQARLFHLARLISSIDLDTKAKSVLEVGAGMGDHTEFWLKRGAVTTATDTLQDNVAVIKDRLPDADTFVLDLDGSLDGIDATRHDIIHSFGFINHLHSPARSIAFLAGAC